MIYWLNNQDAITASYIPYTGYGRQIQCDSRNFHVDMAKPLRPSPISLLIHALTPTCLPFWTTEQQRYPNKQITIPSLCEEMSLLYTQIRYKKTETANSASLLHCIRMQIHPGPAPPALQHLYLGPATPSSENKGFFSATMSCNSELVNKRVLTFCSDW